MFGCAGPVLTTEEVAFFRNMRPWGFILFARNVQTPEQVRALTRSLREAADRPEAPVMIDQEGGRVQRLGPPHWPRYPSARAFSRWINDPLERRELVRLGARLIADDLAALGIDIDCVPVADVPAPGAHDVIGDRAYGETAAEVAVLARAAAEGLIAGGVLPVIKHIPGHGRARVDSHVDLPRVEAAVEDLDRVDFAPFRALSDMPLAMTAHVVYAAVDPRRCATLSRRVIHEVVRGSIGFSGLLITDDLSMKALQGDLTSRARAALGAGCDIALHCNGDMAQMQAVAEGARRLTGRAAGRAAAALARRPRIVEPLDRPAMTARFDAALSGWRAQ